MNFAFVAGDATKARAEVVFLPVFDSELSSKKEPNELLVAADKKTRGALLKLADAEGFKARAEQVFVFQPQGKLPATRLVLLGLGSRATLTHETLRQAAGRAAKLAQRLKAKQLAFAVPMLSELDAFIKAVVEGFELGAYSYGKWKSRKQELPVKLDRVQLYLPQGVKKQRSHDEMAAQGRLVAEATNWARDLVNEPPASLTPTALAEEAKAMAKEAGLNISIGDRKKITELKMGMFLGVARGSVEEPRLVQLSYVPRDPEEAKRKPVVFVGKAITFDSGGLSLKPSDAMIDMKTDMAGSAAVLGAIKVVAKLKPSFPVHAFFGACENMPSGNAYRLGDVLTARNGKTVEITNTDAEGRLVLGDVLTWASELKPAAIIDLATLTGACIVALGHVYAGAFSPNDELFSDVQAAALNAGEELWRLPVSEYVRDVIKSEIADLKNAGDRAGGASSAALFLKEFVGDAPWLHLDIAGPSQSPRERGYYGKGATGCGVRTLVEFVLRHKAKLAVQAD